MIGYTAPVSRPLHPIDLEIKISGPEHGSGPGTTNWNGTGSDRGTIDAFNP